MVNLMRIHIGAAALMTSLMVSSESAFSDIQPTTCYNARTGREEPCRSSGSSSPGSSQPDRFAPSGMEALRPDFIRAQQAISDSLGHYEDESDTIIGSISRHLLERMPIASPTTLAELDDAAEDLAQFFEGYRQAYLRAAEKVIKAERELAKNQSAIADYKRHEQEYKDQRREWERNGGLQRVAKAERVFALTRLDDESQDIAVSLLRRIEQSPLARAHQLQLRTASIDDIERAIERSKQYSGRHPTYLHRAVSDFRHPPPAPRGAVPIRQTFSNNIPPLSLNKSSKPTAEARIVENLGYIRPAELILAINTYIDSTAGNPRDLLRAHYTSLVELESTIHRAESARNSLPSQPLTSEAHFLKGIQDLEYDGLTSVLRWAIWKSLERIATPLPEKFDRFLKVQELVVRFAREDMQYIGEATKVLATGSPQEIATVKENLDTAVCKFTAAFGKAAWGLPKPFDAGPFSAWIKTPDQLACQ